MRLDGVDRLAAGGVPDLDGAVEAGGGERLAVGTEGDLVDEAGVPFELGRRRLRERDRGEEKEGGKREAGLHDDLRSEPDGERPGGGCFRL